MFILYLFLDKRKWQNYYFQTSLGIGTMINTLDKIDLILLLIFLLTFIFR